MIMKYEYMSFNRSPSKKCNLSGIDSIIEEKVEEMKSRCFIPRNNTAKIVKRPWNTDQFIDKTNDQKKNNDMIIQSSTKCSIEENKIKN